MDVLIQCQDGDRCLLNDKLVHCSSSSYEATKTKPNESHWHLLSITNRANSNLPCFCYLLTSPWSTTKLQAKLSFCFTWLLVTLVTRGKNSYGFFDSACSPFRRQHPLQVAFQHQHTMQRMDMVLPSRKGLSFQAQAFSTARHLSLTSASTASNLLCVRVG